MTYWTLSTTLNLVKFHLDAYLSRLRNNEVLLDLPGIT